MDGLRCPPDMRLMARRLVAAAMSLALALTLAGCYLHDTTAADGAEMQGSRVIIAFRSERVADAPDTLKELAHAGGVPLRYLATVGPRTHVFLTAEPLAEAAFEALLIRLNQSPLIDYAEADRRMAPAHP